MTQVVFGWRLREGKCFGQQLAQVQSQQGVAFEIHREPVKVKGKKGKVKFLRVPERNPEALVFIRGEYSGAPTELVGLTFFHASDEPSSHPVRAPTMGKVPLSLPELATSTSC